MKQSFYVQPLRVARNLIYRALEPLDFIARGLNRMPQYPPIALRRHVSHLGILDGPGYEFVAYLKLLAGLQNGARVWDLGCGCGMLELALESARWEGSLIGTDIHLPSIRWARRKIAPRYPSCRFEHADIMNPAYHPGGKMTAGEWLSVFKETGFDLVVAKSFFTHTLPDETGLYLRSISARLAPGGRALLTWFVLNAETRRLMEEGRSAFRFQNAGPGTEYAVRHRDAPTAAVAYREDYLFACLDNAGLDIVGDIHRGYWSGWTDGISFQDMIVVEKRSISGITSNRA